jgi:hypothetical protein
MNQLFCRVRLSLSAHALGDNMRNGAAQNRRGKVKTVSLTIGASSFSPYRFSNSQRMANR